MPLSLLRHRRRRHLGAAAVCAGCSVACGSTPTNKSSDSGQPAGVCPRLDSYALERELTLPDIPTEASGITYDFDHDSFFIVANMQGRLWEYNRDFSQMLRTLTLERTDSDTEGVEYLGQGKLAVVAENNEVYVVDVSGATTTFDGALGVTFAPSGPPPVSNSGFEGVAYKRPGETEPGRLYVCQEHQPMRVLRFDDNARGGGTSFSEADGTLEVVEAWPAESVLAGQVSDLAGMVYDELSDTLLMVSQESSSVIRVEPETGQVLERLALSNTTTSEGVTLFDSCKLAVVSEPNRVQIYAAR